ncbi:hypothetical protein RclHR1_07330008 [Rhizophagus clarus]|uniref:Tetratricopeptide repeat domain 39B n=1 Tax=Rhizophagus clarus TaxID=94130 RepID=A0A2Z6SBX0_9GLOM|nr:hypothetical protein RclHR1_07330008 [Rhizophagus clarus]GES93194.1 tetratricopeptide repeat domain 39B [Rhizophagus clarus]
MENSDNSDSFLLVSVSNSRQLHLKPKHHIMLILITIVDLIVITLFLMQISWNHSWDLVVLGIFRTIVVLVTSSIRIRDLGWILGGACGVSSLYIIFKANLSVQSKHPIDFGFLLASFVFCQIYWITYILVKTDEKTRRYYLLDSNIFFEEEEYSQSSPLNTLRRDFTLNSNTRTYGATVNGSNNIGILINDGGITSSAIDILEAKRDCNTIGTNTSVSTSLPIPIASSAGKSAKSLNRFKNKMKLQDSEFPLHNHKGKNVADDDEQLNGQNNGINSTSKIYSTKADTSDDFLLSNDDSLLLNDDYGDEGLIVTSIGCGESVRDRYFQTSKEDFLDFKLSALDDGSGDENDETIVAGAGDSNDESLPEIHKNPIKFIEINFNDKKTSTSFEKPYITRKYPSESLGNFHYEEDGEFNFRSNYARGDGDFVGSAPVGNGKWSTLKRKKIDSNQLNGHVDYYLNYSDESKDKEIFKSEIMKNEYDKEKNNYGPAMSPNSSLLTAAFSSELSLQNNSKTKSPEISDEQIQSSEASDTGTSSISKNHSNLSITLPSTVFPANQNNFTPKSSSPLASRLPIFASTEDNETNMIQDNNDSKSNVLPSKKINNLSKTPENVANILLTPIVEESNPLTLKGNPYSLHILRNSCKEIDDINSNKINNNIAVINKKSNHTRTPSNSLQMLFADVQNNDEKNSNNSTNENKNNNLEKDNNYNNQTIFTNSFNTAVKKFWNNEFNEAEGIFNRFKNSIPRWNVTYAEMQLVKHLMTGQSSDNENPELANALLEAEKLAIKVCENKDDFETSFSLFRTDIWKAYIRPNNSPSEDEAGFASLRANYRWDCELAMADILLFHAILQVVGGSEIKGAFNLRKAWKTYSKVRDEIDRIKGDAGKNDMHKSELSSSSNRWSLGSAILGRGSISNMVGFGGNRNHNQDGSSVTLDGINNSVEIYSDIEDCLEFGIGVFYFILSIVPGSFQSILKAIGFNAERDQGIQMLENCYLRNSVRAPFAAFFLLINYLFLPRGLADPTLSLNKAGTIVQECVKKYPKSSPFLFMACQQARKTGQIKEALNHITNGINSCEMIGVTSTNYRFEKGMTYLINLDFTAAKDIFELLFYGNTIVFTGKNGSIRLHGSIHGSIHGSSRLLSKDGSTKKDNSLLKFFEFELRPFCGLCLAGCYLILKSSQIAMKEALDVLKQTKAMTDQNNENNSISVANSIGLLGTSASGLVGFGVGGNNNSDKKEPKTNRYNKFAGRQSAKEVEKNSVTPFLIFIILYLRRDIFYMPLELKKRWANLLESTWKKNYDNSIDSDATAVYLLIRGVFEKFLNQDDPTIAQKTLCECLSMEIGIVSETWVIPHCRYELGELFYKQFGNQEAATEQFRWILKGPRPMSRGGLISRRDSIASIASRTSIDSNSSSYGNSNPDRFKKYEFSKVLKNRCTVATDQIRANIVQPTNILNNDIKFEQPPSPISFYHSRKKSGSSSSLLKEIQEQSILQKHHRRQSSTEIKVGTPTNTENKKSGKNDTVLSSLFVKRHKPRSSSLPLNEERSDRIDNSTSSSKSGSKGKIFGFKLK